MRRSWLVALLTACGAPDDGPTCVPTDDPVTAEDFGRRLSALYCCHLVACDGGVACKGDSTASTDEYGDCAFDADAARQCLDGAWTCDDEGFAIQPAICATVFTCPATTPG